jgi:hypothetical protein
VEVEYVLRVDDVLALHRYYLERKPSKGQRHWLLALVAILLTGLLWLYYSLAAGGDVMTTWVLTAFFVAMAFFALFQRKLMPAQVLRLMRKQLDEEWSKKLGGWRRLSISPESISFTGKLMTASALWEAVEQIAVTEDHAFFFTTRRTGFVLPARAFPDEEAFREFVKTARYYRRAAADNSTEDSPPRRRARVEETGFMAEEPTDD